MHLIQQFLEGSTAGPFRNLLDLLSLNPERLIYSLILLGSLVLMNDLVRTALMTEHTRSVLNHMIICVLTIWPGIMLGIVLLYAAYRYPQRAWINLGLAILLYVAWWAGGTLTHLARQDTEGADLGWMSHGLIITVFFGLIAGIWF